EGGHAPHRGVYVRPAGPIAPRGRLPRSACGALRTTQASYRGPGYAPRLGNHRGDLTKVRRSWLGRQRSRRGVTGRSPPEPRLTSGVGDTGFEPVTSSV